MAFFLDVCEMDWRKTEESDSTMQTVESRICFPFFFFQKRQQEKVKVSVVTVTLTVVTVTLTVVLELVLILCNPELHMQAVERENVNH